MRSLNFRVSFADSVPKKKGCGRLPNKDFVKVFETVRSKMGKRWGVVDFGEGKKNVFFYLWLKGFVTNFCKDFYVHLRNGKVYLKKKKQSQAKVVK